MHQSLHDLLHNLTSHLIGSDPVSRLLITGLLADGHVLIQGAPGTGKTTLAKTLAASVDCTLHRIQFTADLLPSDIIGYSIYDPSIRGFVFHQGPVFSHIVLADEINRASPRTQSALLESMNEKQVTNDGVTYALEPPFFLVATENPISSAGTFPLPDSQLDRFILSFEMPVPDAATQAHILSFHAAGGASREVPIVLSREDLIRMQSLVRTVQIAPALLEYIVRLATAIRQREEFLCGLSSRACIALISVARAAAFLDGRDTVYPDDIQQVMPFVFRHRLSLHRVNGRQERRVEAILREVAGNTEVPMHA